MSKVSNAIAGFKSRLTIKDEGLMRMLPFAAWLSFLALIAIYTSHRADQKVHEIENLSKTRQSLEAEHTETREKLTKLSCLLYTSPSPRDRQKSRMPSSA